MGFFGEIGVFLPLSSIGLLEQRDQIFTLKNSNYGKYSFQKLNEFLRKQCATCY
jgi:hypothetical protein